jgi:DnaA-homolog protein
MEQLVFDLAPPEAPSFTNFLTGPNPEVVAVLKRFAAGHANETGLFIWGAPAAGKTHLLRAAVELASAGGLGARYFAEPGELAATDPEHLASNALIAVDAVDGAGADAQARLFTLFNALSARGGHLVTASRTSLAAVALREDLRTRLGWGLAYEVQPLPDADKPEALLAYAQSRGFAVSDEVIRYLLAHGRRDMAALLGALAALDRHSMAAKRPITIPMLREWLQRNMRLE